MVKIYGRYQNFKRSNSVANQPQNVSKNCRDMFYYTELPPQMLYHDNTKRNSKNAPAENRAYLGSCSDPQVEVCGNVLLVLAEIHMSLPSDLPTSSANQSQTIWNQQTGYISFSSISFISPKFEQSR